MEGSILEVIGSDLIGVITPVSICMLLVVLLVSSLSPSPSSTAPTQPQLITAANLVYSETATDSAAAKLTGAIENALVFILLIAAVTFLLVLLYYYNFTSFLVYYMRFSTFFILVSMGGPIFVSIVRRFDVGVDVVSFCLFMFNFSAVGVVAVFGGGGVPIVVTQGYTVGLGIVTAAWFTQLPEWTTWVLLVALAVYDLVAVLAPGGPLKILVELAQSRDDDLPALVYEARPRVRVSDNTGMEMQSLGRSNGGDVEGETVGLVSRLEGASDIEVVGGGRGDDLPALVYEARPRVRVTRSEGGVGGLGMIGVSDNSGMEMQSLGRSNGGDVEGEREGETVVLVSRLEGASDIEVAGGGRGRDEEGDSDGDDSESTIRGIKLGLGDFVFYSVLVGRAAMYDLMTVYACYLAIISGLACTLILLSVWRRALPALPISIGLGVVFYFLTRLLMEPFVVQTSINLLMF